jgi:hypothetical protein
MTISGWISVAGLWVLFFWLYRDYRLDAFRQDLFALRDELFNIAAEGQLTFSSRAYGMLRSSLNGNIQFGHKWGFLDVLSFFLFTRRQAHLNHAAECYRVQWEDAIGTLDSNTRAAVESIRTRMHLRIAQQIVSTSAVLMVTLITLVCWVLLCLVRNVIVRFMVNLLSGPRIGRYIDLFDSASVLRLHFLNR